jgi:hypothetical protein
LQAASSSNGKPAPFIIGRYANTFAAAVRLADLTGDVFNQFVSSFYHFLILL